MDARRLDDGEREGTVLQPRQVSAAAAELPVERKRRFELRFGAPVAVAVAAVVPEAGVADCEQREKERFGAAGPRSGSMEDSGHVVVGARTPASTKLIGWAGSALMDSRFLGADEDSHDESEADAKNRQARLTKAAHVSPSASVSPRARSNRAADMDPGVAPLAPLRPQRAQRLSSGSSRGKQSVSKGALAASSAGGGSSNSLSKAKVPKTAKTSSESEHDTAAMAPVPSEPQPQTQTAAHALSRKKTSPTKVGDMGTVLVPSSLKQTSIHEAFGRDRQPGSKQARESSSKDSSQHNDSVRSFSSTSTSSLNWLKAEFDAQQQQQHQQQLQQQQEQQEEVPGTSTGGGKRQTDLFERLKWSTLAAAEKDSARKRVSGEHQTDEVTPSKKAKPTSLPAGDKISSPESKRAAELAPGNMTSRDLPESHEVDVEGSTSAAIPLASASADFEIIDLEGDMEVSEAPKSAAPLIGKQARTEMLAGPPLRECSSSYCAQAKQKHAHEVDSFRIQMENTQAELEVLTKKHAETDERARALTDLLRDSLKHAAKQEREHAARDVNAQCQRLGRVAVQRSGTSLNEVWEDGPAFRDLQTRSVELAERRERLERERKDLARKFRTASVRALAESEHGGVPDKAKMQMPPPPSRAAYYTVVAASAGDLQALLESPVFISEQEEIIRLQLAEVKREESVLIEEKNRLEMQRSLLIRELKRQTDEKASRFSDFKVLHERYLLTKMLGRGGFSEVFKAFDLVTLTWVACKIHQLHSYWREEKKQNYLRHATREYNIHKSLVHPRVIRLLDVFEIDSDSFCTVLEFCAGTDLELHLQVNKMLSEKEARSIVSQICMGLAYLNQQKKRIIHYDLKPGNILISQGQARITDFGLSKIMNEDDNTHDGMELTSQGCGTYWYLPPECFERGAQPARISSKVDVWSVGVILYQMLFGKKPFANELSQERIYRDPSVLHAEVLFPSKPAVSADARAFISDCLTRNQSLRPDVQKLLEHPFLSGRK